MEFIANGVAVLALRTPTLPPATHTNCYVIGEEALTVVDPASPWEDQRGILLDELDARHRQGEVVSQILLTHHHWDHTGGVAALQASLAERGLDVPIVAHIETARRLPDLSIHPTLRQGDELDLGGVKMRVHHVPGHAPGHVILHDEATGVVVAGDMVAGVGTIVIDPADGDLGDYLDSLERMRALNASVLLPAHGPSLPHADAILSMYIAHRHQRTEQIFNALSQLGEASSLDLVPPVYPDLPIPMHPVAAMQVTSHLLWMKSHAMVFQKTRSAGASSDERWQVVR